MANQLDMQREDYELAVKDGKAYVCKACGAITISTCEDVEQNACFYCGSKDVSWDKEQVEAALGKRIKEGTL